MLTNMLTPCRQKSSLTWHSVYLVWSLRVETCYNGDKWLEQT